MPRNTPLFRPVKPLGLWLCILVLMTTISGFFASQPVQAADTLSNWTELPIQPVKNGSLFGIDGTRPNSIVSFQLDHGIASQNWVTTESKQLQTGLLQKWNYNTGIYYAATRSNPSQAVYFNLNNPQGEAISRIPNLIAGNGSLQVYSAEPDLGPVQNFYASADAGKNWQKRPLPFPGKVPSSLSFSLASADPRVVYALTEEDTGSLIIYRIFVSTDGGSHWEGRSDIQIAKPNPVESYSGYLYNLEGYSVPVDTIIVDLPAPSGAKSLYRKLISTDGARTFKEVDQEVQYLAYDNTGLVRLKQSGTNYSLDTSNDGGRNWETHALPFNIPSNAGAWPVNIQQVTNAPGNFLVSLRSGDYLWHTPDSGRSWHKIAALPKDMSLMVTPYSPTALIASNGSKYYILNNSLPQIDQTHTSRVAANKVPDGNYFPATGHNLSGVFKKYWDEHGGLAQFGYPQTEPFREYNPADGKIYLVQYFERNRFEYHPEFAGTNYEVLLGLLGNQLTEQRRAAGEGAFNRFPDMHYPAGQYFAATGHNLRNSFKQYWDANGGLAQFGYPTSEEFNEINPDDGKTYVVQYFERNRLEYHPENKGSKYEVLLGLLGNTLLKQKSWL